uniref:DM domain-containing protein n=1 Tax=Strongyloides stercoralis TaxID=6248 RepID=A0A0K0ECV0_STRER
MQKLHGITRFSQIHTFDVLFVFVNYFHSIKLFRNILKISLVTCMKDSITVLTSINNSENLSSSTLIETQDHLSFNNLQKTTDSINLLVNCTTVNNFQEHQRLLQALFNYNLIFPVVKKDFPDISNMLRFEPFNAFSALNVAAVSGFNTDSLKTGTQKRVYYCQRCLNHDRLEPRKNHKCECAYANCSCPKCILVEKRRVLNTQLHELEDVSESPINLEHVKKEVDDIYNDNGDDNGSSSEHSAGGRIKGERVPNCQKCGQHGIKSRLKGHKRVCRFKDCNCPKCQVVTERQKLMADQIKIRRRQRKDTILNITREKITQSLNAVAAITNASAQFPYVNGLNLLCQKINQPTSVNQLLQAQSNSLANSLNYSNQQNSLSYLSAAVAAAAGHQQASDLLKIQAATNLPNISTANIQATIGTLSCGNTSSGSPIQTNISTPLPLILTTNGNTSPTSSNTTSIGTMPSSPGTITATSPTSSSISSGTSSSDENTPIAAPIAINPSSGITIATSLPNPLTNISTTTQQPTNEQLYSFLANFKLFDQQNLVGNNTTNNISGLTIPAEFLCGTQQSIIQKDDNFVATVAAAIAASQASRTIESPIKVEEGTSVNNNKNTFIDVCSV